MTQRREIEPLLDHWFQDGPSNASDRVLDVVTDRIWRQPQRPAWRLDWRHPFMHPNVKLATAIAAVVIVAIVGYALIPRSSGVGVPNPTPSTQPSQAGSPSPAASAATLVLKVATVEDGSSPAHRALTQFVGAFAQASGSSIRLVVVDQAAGDQTRGENALLAALRQGTFDIGIVPTRAWASEHVTSFDATMTPLLIDSLPLAGAVAKDPIAQTMLQGASSTGMTGLAMWPEDLRHPVSFGAPLVTPAGFAGHGIRAIPGDITTEMIAALGGRTFDVQGDAFASQIADGSIVGAESGLQNAASLPDPGTFTGNITFYPRMDVLVIRPETLARLAPAQRDAVIAAARATTDYMIANGVSDATAAPGYCTAGGKVALATAAQKAAFAAALQPVVDDLRKDTATKAFIDRITVIKATLPKPQDPAACGS
jgi:TRAP-type C4-dicarboxylate transport system substrate-binding protein